MARIAGVDPPGPLPDAVRLAVYCLALQPPWGRPRGAEAGAAVRRVSIGVRWNTVREGLPPRIAELEKALA